MIQYNILHIDADQTKPTNGEFIALISDKLILEQAQNNETISGHIS